MDQLVVRRAQAGDLDELSRLFHLYRQFYNLPSEPAKEREFLNDRLANHEAVVFLAEAGPGVGVGFTLLYPLFSEATLKRIWLLNDLFVDPQGRRQGAGGALLEAARSFAVDQDSTELTLSTARDNGAAQRLYEAHGYTRDDQFWVYRLNLARG